MITPEALREKTAKWFFKIVAAQLQGNAVFPLTVPVNKQLPGTNYSDWQQRLVPLHKVSKAVKGTGISVDWKERKVNGIQQSLPVKLYFETLDDYLVFVNRVGDYLKISEAFTKLTGIFPALKTWAVQHVAELFKEADNVDDLLKVCRYFVNNPPPHDCYIRELPISVHSKFIEDNAAILRKWLDILLPEAWVNRAENDFSARYHIKRAQIFTQIRLLDEALKTEIGYHQLALTLDDAASLGWRPEKVFIIENKATYLAIPSVKNAVAIFGEGFKSRVSRHIPWLNTTALYCWFDLDASGFEMLNMIRKYYPAANSLMMDINTYHTFETFAGHKKQRFKKLPLLNEAESGLYAMLTQTGQWLEQERISQAYILQRINDTMLRF